MAVFRRLVVALVAMLLSTTQVGAQEGATGTITGRVVDSTSQQPLSNVTVQILGTQLGALTGSDGAFRVTGVPVGERTVRARRIGYGQQDGTVSVSAGGTATVTLSLTTTAAQLSEVVVVGYGTQRREAVTGAVATVDAEQANVGVIPNVNGLIQGRVAGVNVVTNNGEPGAGAQVRIRGGTSISASNEPLYVIDGVPIQNQSTEAGGIGIGGGAALNRSPLNLLNPNDIESVTILKDASATAIYGSRGANGVVLIETKRGAREVAEIEYDGYSAFSTPASRLDFLSGDEYRSVVQGFVTRGELSADRLSALGSANTDWESELTRTSVTQNHNLAFSGGSAATQYRAALNFMDQQGVVISNGFQRYQGRLNANHQAFDNRLRLGLNLTASRMNNDYLPFENTGGFEGGVFANMAMFNPTQAVRDTTGAFYELGTGSQSLRNPVALARQISDVAGTNRILGNLNAGIDLLPGLAGSLNIGTDRSDGVRRTYFPRVSPVGAQWNGRARQVERSVTTLTFQSLLTYTPTFENHEFEIVGGYEYNDFQTGEFGAEGRNFLTDAFSFNNLGGGADLIPPFSWREESRLVSFFARANYGFANKYFLTGVLRRDGSSRFGSGNKWAVFPAISGAWRVSEEAFMANSPFSDLRLRIGYGLQGNQAVGPYSSLILLEPNNGARYPFGDAIVTGVVPTRNENPNLKWEETEQYNVGLDYGFANNRFVGTLEYYVKKTRDLLLTVNVPQPALVSTRLENVGSLNNRGFEATLDAQVLTRPTFDWSAGVVLAVERNEVEDLGGRTFITTAGVSGQGQTGQNAQRIIPGQPLGTFWGPVFVGHNEGGQQLFNDYEVERDAAGNEISRTLVGTTVNPTPDDATIIGSANPSFSLGLRSNANWNRFDISLLLRAEVGQDVFNNTALIYASKGNLLQGRNLLGSALTAPDTISEAARFSSRWIEDGSFVRLQNVTVGYTFTLPSRLGQGTNARVYLSGDNLLLFTDYSGYDPEVFVDAGLASRGVDYLVYPRARTFTTGVRVQF